MLGGGVYLQTVLARRLVHPEREGVGEVWGWFPRTGPRGAVVATAVPLDEVLERPAFFNDPPYDVFLRRSA